MMPRIAWHCRTLALVLATALTCGIGCSGQSADSQSLTLTGSSTVAPLVAEAAKRYEDAHPGIRIDVQTGGSSRGISDVQSGLADLGMISRALKPEEKAVLAEHGIAMDGVCLIVHQGNAVENLTKQQVIDIYTGRIENWKDTGGPDRPIVVVNKAEGRATLDVFLEYTGLDHADVKADVVVGENQHAIKTVAGNPKSIGYVSIGMATAEAEAGTPIKLVSSDGVLPTPEAVASGEFPLVRPLQIVTHGEIPLLANRFLNYLKSDEIEDLVVKHLYVPLKD